MSDTELLEPFVQMLAQIATPQAVREVERGGSAATMWQELAASGFLDALVAEEHGGAGLSLAQVEPLIGAVGAFAVPLPVAETMVARALVAAADGTMPDGPIALATSATPGVVVPGVLVAAHVLIDLGDRLTLEDVAALDVQPIGIPNALGARVTWPASTNGQEVPRPAGGLRPIAAVLRAALIAGAAGRLTDMTTAYANERVQFGKPIGRQQALQQNLAVMAEDMIATRIASQLACAAGLAAAPVVAAMAKSTASAAAGRLAATAHAVFGAIGVSEEFDLQLLTRRLYEWRLADGSESYWNRLLGEARLPDERTTLEWVRTEIFV